MGQRQDLEPLQLVLLELNERIALPSARTGLASSRF